MTDKRKAMVTEILAFVETFKRESGRKPTQQEIDDFMYSWRKNG